MTQRRILLFPLILLIFALLVYPIAILGWNSLSGTGGLLDAEGAGLSLDNYAEILRDGAYRDALIHSVGLSLVVAIGSIVLCLGPAWLFVRRSFFGKRLLRALFTLPMSFSGIIVGFLVIIMLGRIGFIPQMFERVFGRALFSGAAYQFSGLVIAYIYFEIPRATLSLESSLKKFDFRLEAAAKSLGAGRLQRLVYILIPLMWPALVSAFAITFSVSLGSFGVALILSRRFSILPVEIFQQLTAFLDTGLASAMSLVLLMVAFTTNYAARRLADSRDGGHA